MALGSVLKNIKAGKRKNLRAEDFRILTEAVSSPSVRDYTLTVTFKYRSGETQQVIIKKKDLKK